MKELIQQTQMKDFSQTEILTRESFWNLYRPGAVEHLILHNLRNRKCYISELDLVVIFEDEIIGHMITTKAKVVDLQNNEHEVLCAGPLSVNQKFRNTGIGSMLMNNSIQIATRLGFSGMILFGNPDYYHRFGFRNALEYGISTKEGQNFEPFMALELQPDGLAHVKGRFFEDTAFETEPIELVEFEKQFPYKEKLVTDTQLNFE